MVVSRRLLKMGIFFRENPVGVVAFAANLVLGYLSS